MSAYSNGFEIFVTRLIRPDAPGFDDAGWQQHPDKYKDYPLQRFTEDWTTASPVGEPIHSHHVDISKTDGTGAFGSGIIVAVRVNGDHKLFMWYERKDGTLTEPAPHMLQYD